ncbi:hypothetical protein GCM10023172_18460 [Hymenobacter ginsengisoli]|uniref:Fibronectin type-III domain-containing protein n=1 Tax=Hymenobacter ginsengisoli TaxID=1051626 RepID=A0ABP8QBT5_9BACT|nr:MULTISPECIES: hypothetical protein [unclassified Hymenobacter]MBO2031595.1 hypothetical protein [Hymenobacter sp. BT559]
MTFFLLMAVGTARAQVPNDNIENRRLLRAEETITSSTVGCTVQPGCVDERLTGKCIEYHNDQWFEFRPPASGTYYVNIGGQRCRDVRGVQLVVLTGTPCQPATYRILSCTSLGTQDDLFVPLPNLQAGQPYLLDVDGYLKDYCGFTLQVSGQARGLPVVPAPAVPHGPPAMSRIVTLAWQVPDSLASARYCRVLRRELHEFRAREIWRQPLAINTYGQRQLAYTTTDTLATPGQYLYQIVAGGEPSDGPPTLLQQRWAAYSQLRPIMPGAVASGVVFVTLPLARYPRRAQLAIVVSNPENGRVLRRLPLALQAAGPGQGRIYAQPWFDVGIRQVAVAITCYPPGAPAYTEQLLLPLAAAP